MTINITMRMECNINVKIASSLLLKVNPEASNNSADMHAAHITHHPSATTVDSITPKFLTYRDLIYHSSPYFSAALDGQSIEVSTQSATLEIDENAFGVVANWLCFLFPELSNQAVELYRVRRVRSDCPQEREDSIIL
jgi:hypothetical protein